MGKYQHDEGETRARLPCKIKLFFGNYALARDVKSRSQTLPIKVIKLMIPDGVITWRLMEMKMLDLMIPTGSETVNNEIGSLPCISATHSALLEETPH